MNKVFAAFWYSGILPLLSCTTTIPTTTTTFENHESLSRPQSAKKAKKAGTKAKQNSKQNREKELEKKDEKKKCFPQIIWLKDQWRKSKKEKDQQPMSPYLALRLLGDEQLKKKKKDPLEPKTSMEEKTSIEARLRAGRAAVERATKLSRLNTAVDETTKVVQELKTEFSGRKSSRNLQVSSSKTEISTSPYKTRGKHTEPIPQSSIENRDNVQDSGVFVTEKGECASSLLTEEPQQEVLEMDRLEAELESELQKLLGCSTEASGFEGKISDICEFNTDIHVQDSGVFVTEEGECASSVLTEEPQQEVLEMDRLEAELESELQKLPRCSTELLDKTEKYQTFNEDASFEGFYKPDGQTSDSCQLSEVLPSELGQKLCHLLIEQQESQIVGLESELHWAQSKLHEKEAELQALKDCSRDEESEAQKEEEKIIDHGDYDNKMGPESKRSVVGMKRSMDFEPYSCDMK
ncbi:hypothetical protein HYC85_006693 [Camellia sinensis]|uniref:Uncharacterized protein n=1 Tax=Camellia sinensis TaxID=4442 RepID=A0A7J7HMZ6_CAMSI|nr:hypothetical protein HYC85_006693 [Camellia sinensis]